MTSADAELAAEEAHGPREGVRAPTRTATRRAPLAFALNLTLAPSPSPSRPRPHPHPQPSTLTQARAIASAARHRARGGPQAWGPSPTQYLVERGGGRAISPSVTPSTRPPHPHLAHRDALTSHRTLPAQFLPLPLPCSCPWP